MESFRCLGVQLDNELKWDTLVNELIKSYTKNSNLLRSMHFLPVRPWTDFYFKVILPAVKYGIAVWGSCGSTLFTELEKIHVSDAKIIYKLDWLTPSEEVLQRVKWHTPKTDYITTVLVLRYILLMVLLQQVYKIPPPPPIKCASNFLLKSVRYGATKLWNDLPTEVRAKQSLAAFKAGLKKVQI